ncbi:hypothetical protein RchiOBHm_Chr2g0107241 [Rosa chinensis]|uniref:Uncharacterized protein n=2 Tax=Rosa chinensis TaxID=74649 RepID=A0A2P6RNY7_ROSCH|nr:hypothetical protein RchiOBHm_Chr2g0107241 [Rosa chinensis]
MSPEASSPGPSGAAADESGAEKVHYMVGSIALGWGVIMALWF